MPMNMFDQRMNGFCTELPFVFKHFTTVFLPVLPMHFMLQWSTLSTVVRCLQNHSHFRSRSSYIPFRYVVRYRPNTFVLREMYCYSFTSGKTYLLIQTWRMVKWFQYPCHDVGCYPCFHKVYKTSKPWSDHLRKHIWYLSCLLTKPTK